MQEGMYILYQFNEKYAPYAGVSMTSLFENNKAAEFIYIYVLGEGLSDGSVERFNMLAARYGRQVAFVATDGLVEKMKSLNMPTYRGSYAANMRLFVSEIIECAASENHLYTDANGVQHPPKRLLYLDADTVVTGDLSRMYNSNIKTIGMVYDSLGCIHKYDLGFSEEEGYYNSGVILYDLEKWQDNDFTGKIIDHVKNVRAQYPSPDQDLLNVVVRSEISPLGIECNFQPHLKDYSYDSFVKAFELSPFYKKQEVEAATTEPVVLHAYRYLGEFPWHAGNLHPFNDDFDKYLAISPWNDYEKQPSDGGAVMAIERAMYRFLPKRIFLAIFRFMHRRFYKKADKLSRSNRISPVM